MGHNPARGGLTRMSDLKPGDKVVLRGVVKTERGRDGDWTYVTAGGPVSLLGHPWELDTEEEYEEVEGRWCVGHCCYVPHKLETAGDDHNRVPLYIKRPRHVQAEPREVRRCGDVAPRLLVGEAPRNLCKLPAGHVGYHRADDGEEWSVAEERVELTEERWFVAGHPGPRQYREFLYDFQSAHGRRVKAVILEPAHQHHFTCECGESHD